MSNIDRFHDLLKIWESVKYSLIGLGKAFTITGNEKMAIELYDLSKDIDYSEKEIRKVYDEDLNEKLNMARQGATNVLNAVIAVGVRDSKKE